MWNIFEHPWSLIAAAIIVSLAIMIVRSFAPQKHRWWHFALPVLIIIAAFALDFFFQTETELIKNVVNSVITAVEEENCSAIERIIAENYHDSKHRSKRSLIINCTSKLSSPIIEKIIKRIISIEIASPNATAVLTARVMFDEESEIYQGFRREMFTKVKLDLQKQRDKKWLISRAEILEIDLQPAGWKNIQY